MSNKNTYWQDLADLNQDEEVLKSREGEFASDLPITEVLNDERFQGASTGRRDFLKFLGFGIGAASLAACETPVIYSVPYVNKPEEIMPGVANYYASTYYDGDDFASIVVKTREGRPIFIKGNPGYGINNHNGAGAINARVNASVLSLYDSARLRNPLMGSGDEKKPASWKDVDAGVAKGLSSAAAAGKSIVVLTNTVISPSTKRALAMLQGKFASGDESSAVKHVQVDSISYSGVLAANQESFGKRVMPSYDLTKADVVVGVGCDFLTSWGSSTEHSWQYASRRKPGNMSRHWQFETRMSSTGANADERIMIKPSETADYLIALHNNLGVNIGSASEAAVANTKALAAELKAARGRSVVMCGSNDKNIQVIVNSINAALGNYGSTIDLNGHSNMYQGDDAAFQELVNDMAAGRVGAVLIANVNPAYSSAASKQFRDALAKVPTRVSFSLYDDETSALCNYVCPSDHYLESWDDAEPRVGHYAMSQPTITNLFDTRQWQQSILKWSGYTGSYRMLIKETCESKGLSYNQTLHDGGHGSNVEMGGGEFTGNASAAASAAQKNKTAGAWEVELYTKASVGNGAHANNPWLQELPGALSKVTWDNYACISMPDMMKLLGTDSFKDLYIGQDSPAKLIKVTVDGVEYMLPALPSPGQAEGTISVALGYGRGANGEAVGKAACSMDEDGVPQPVGVNVYPMARLRSGATAYTAVADVAITDETYPLALTQTHMTGMDRHSIIKETSQGVWAKHDPENTYNHSHALPVHEDVNKDGEVDVRDKKHVSEIDLWAEHPVENIGHRWGMSIDLNACNACGACIVACSAENNVPVVGKDEVRRSRDMHWLRLDRYYSSDMTKKKAKEEGLGKISMYTAMEVPSNSPKVVFMPMMCQHCNHAPCETVCPVAATTHSNEGLNQMTYNRCIGTRYCANNCPYKVRRFNWWNYNSPKFADVNPAYNELGRMVLNPDVTVRARGVIEKCSMCVQRIQAGKLEAKKNGAPLPDGSVQTACSAACANGAIVFGDLNDKKSKVAEREADERSYYALEEIGVRPNISYMAMVRNTNDSEGHA